MSLVLRAVREHGHHEDRDRLDVAVIDTVTATHTVDVTIIVTVALTLTAKRIEGTRASVAVDWWPKTKWLSFSRCAGRRLLSIS